VPSLLTRNEKLAFVFIAAERHRPCHRWPVRLRVRVCPGYGRACAAVGDTGPHMNHWVLPWARRERRAPLL